MTTISQTGPTKRSGALESNQLLAELPQVSSINIDEISINRPIKSYSLAVTKRAARLTESLKFLMPILIDAKGRIVAGEVWYRAAKYLELDEVPVIRVLQMSPAQIQAYQIAELRLHELAPWDNEALGLAFKDLSQQDLDFDLEVTGFATTEIDLLIEGVTSSRSEKVQADLAPPLTTDPPISRLGDAFNLGKHRIFCGSSLESQSYYAVMAKERAIAVITDPPYNVTINGHAGGKGKIQHPEFAMATGEMTSGEFGSFLETFFRLAAQFSTDGSLHYIFMDWRHAAEVLAAGNAAYKKLLNLCVWAKKNGGMGSFYRSRHELVFVFKNGIGPHRNNVNLGKHGRNRTNVWEYDGINSFRRVTDEGNLLAMHPTVKPVQMIADAILDCSARGGIILDPFLGSGSSLIAAERTGRVLRGIELDPRYIDVAIRRWQQHTGSYATHAVSGDRFDAIGHGKETRS